MSDQLGPPAPDGPGPDLAEHGGWGSPLPSAYGRLEDPAPPPSAGEEPGAGRMIPNWLRPNGAESSLLRRLHSGETPVVAAVGGGGSGLAFSPAEAYRPPHVQPEPDPAGAAGPVPGPTLAPVADPVEVGAGAELSGDALARARPLPAGGRRLRPARTRARATVRKIDVLTVARVSAMFYLVLLVVIVVADVLLWFAADSFGTLPSIEKSVRTLFSLKTFHLHVTTVALYAGAFGLVLTVVGTLANVLLAFVYNLISDVVGGVRVELETSPRD